MLDSRRPGPAFAAPSQDRQPAEVRVIWGYDSKDKAIIFLLLYHRGILLCPGSTGKPKPSSPKMGTLWPGRRQGGLRPKAQPQ